MINHNERTRIEKRLKELSAALIGDIDIKIAAYEYVKDINELFLQIKELDRVNDDYNYESHRESDRRQFGYRW